MGGSDDDKRNILLEWPTRCCCAICVYLVMIISTVFCFTGPSFSYYEKEDRPGPRSSFS